MACAWRVHGSTRTVSLYRVAPAGLLNPSPSPNPSPNSNPNPSPNPSPSPNPNPSPNPTPHQVLKKLGVYKPNKLCGVTTLKP